jgi:hypothetical protein
MHIEVWWESQTERDHYEVPSRMWVDSIKRTDLAQDKSEWRALVNKVINVLVRQNVEILLSSSVTGGF